MPNTSAIATGVAKSAAVLALFTCLAHGQGCTPSWEVNAGPPGATAIAPYVHAQIEHDDGNGPALYVGGVFSAMDGVPAAGVAKWDGNAWSALGSGVSTTGTNPAAIWALASFDDGTGRALYAAGSFMSAGGFPCANLAKWSNGVWSPVGGGVGGGVGALCAYENGPIRVLFVGGTFATVGAGIAVSNIAAWDGVAWQTMGGGVSGGTTVSVNAIIVHDDGTGDAVYAGGTFDFAGGMPAVKIARYDTNGWTAPGGGINGTFSGVSSLRTFDFGSGTELVAGGGWVLGPPGSAIMRLSGGTWIPVGAGLPNFINSMTVHDFGAGPQLCTVVSWGGGCSTGGCGLRAWNGSAWQSLGPALLGVGHVYSVYSRTSAGGPALTVGGGITGAPGSSSKGIVEWKGTTFGPVGPGISGPVNALARFDSGGGPEVVAAGSFSFASGVLVNGIARRSTGAWAPFASGLTDGTGTPGVLALAEFDFGAGPELVAGGTFTTSAATSVSRIARWNGNAWAPIGAGFDAPVRALAVHDAGGGPELYAGGDFTSSGGVGVSHVARWTGSSWAPLGAGVSNTVFALASVDVGQGQRLFAGGSFTMSGATPMSRIGQWDGTSWTPVAPNVGFYASGVNNTVKSLLPVDVDGPGGLPAQLVVGGLFLSAKAGAVMTTSAGIVRWDGVAWTSFGGGVIAVPGVTEVAAIAVFDDGTGPALYAGGNITGTNGMPGIPNLAKWDGVAWSAVAGGATGGLVRALLATDVGAGPSLYASGEFTAVGVIPASYFARLVAPAAVGFVPVQPATISVLAGQPVALSVAPTGTGPFTFQWRKDGADIVGATSSIYAISVSQFSDNGSYAALVANGCTSTLSPPTTLFVRTFALSLAIPSGPGSLQITRSGGLPGASCFTALSLDPANAAAPGSGWLGGLHVAFDFAIFQFNLQAPPFVSILDANGAGSFAFPPGSVPPVLSGMTLWAVALSYDPMTLGLTGLSTLTSITLL